LRAALEDVARREVAFHAKDAGVAERAASRIVAKLLAGPMAVLRKHLQRGEPLDAHAMMLFEMFAAGNAPVERAPRQPKSARAARRVTTPARASESVDGPVPAPPSHSPVPVS
jgi:hypothetical protein